MTKIELYAPIDRPKPVVPDVWVVDGPLIPMRPFGIELPFPTRMTAIRLPGGELWVHSPIAPDDGLFAALAALGPVAHLVAPNSLHYWWVGDWQRRFPDARVHAVPGAAARARRKGREFRVDRVLATTPAAPDAPWGEAIETILVRGSAIDEAVFFHRPSRSLILTDLVQNYDREKLQGAWLLLLMRLGGVMSPHGTTPRDLRLTSWGAGAGSCARRPGR